MAKSKGKKVADTVLIRPSAKVSNWRTINNPKVDRKNIPIIPKKAKKKD
jgi:hypothetical protein